jgi:hypothetical protein
MSPSRIAPGPWRSGCAVSSWQWATSLGASDITLGWFYLIGAGVIVAGGPCLATMVSRKSA